MILPDFSPYLAPPSAPAAYHQMEEAAYHAFPAVSSGLLKECTQAEMLFNRMKPSDDGEDKVDRVLGTLTHAIILEPWKFGLLEWEKHYVLCPTKGLDTKAAEETRANNPGKLLVTAELLDIAMRIRREAIETNPDALRFLSSPNGMKEATGIVWDTKFSCARKIRVDYLPMSGTAIGDYLLDIKTTRKSLGGFENEAWNLGYYQQAAYYLDTHEILTGHRPACWRWLVTTKTEPFMSRVFFMRNLKPTDPLYKDPKCKLRQVRERLGLDDSPRIGRLPQFLSAARETQAFRGSLTENMPLAEVRRIWTGYEQSDETEIF